MSTCEIAQSTLNVRRHYREHRDRYVQMRRRHYYATWEREQRSWKRWSEANPEKARKSKRRWDRDNRDYFTHAARKRRARLLKADGFHTPEQVEARVRMFGKLCWICGAPYEAIDHVKPISRGGSDWPANLRPICTSCNSKKSNKWPFDEGGQT